MTKRVAEIIIALMTTSKKNNKSYIFRFNKAVEGYTELASNKNAPLNRLSVGRLRLLKKNRKYKSNTKSKETLLTILVGSAIIETSNKLGRKTFTLGKRDDVFSGLPESLLLGPKTKYLVSSTSRTVDIVISQVDLNSASYKPVVFKESDIEERNIGEKHFRRDVRVILGGGGPAKVLRAGETINDVGGWSSWPHHSFDKHRELHAKFEEVFLFFVKPKESYGLVRMDGTFCNGQTINDGIAVKNGDWAIMPIGNHPVVSAPDSQVYYFWAYISPIPKIYSKWAEDQGGYA